MKLHPKVQELKQRAAAINYTTVSVNEFGNLETRSSLLDERVVEGYAVIWGKPNDYGEKFIKGAFAKSISERGPESNSNYQIKFLRQHDQADPLSLFDELREDDIGLYFRTKPLDKIDSADRVLIQLRSGTLNNFSQGFDFVWDKIEYDSSDDTLIMKEAALFEISVVSIPSDMNTYAIRSKEQVEELHDDTDDFIKTLPRKNQLEARQLFARHKSLANRAMETKGESSDNPNIEFINKMIPHHEMAIDMVAEYKNKVDDKDLLKIMDNIKTSQKEEIVQMKAIKKELNTRHKALANKEPFEQREKTLNDNEPQKKGIDFNYLTQNFKL